MPTNGRKARIKNVQHVIDVQLASQLEQLPEQEKIELWVSTALQDSGSESEICVRVVDEKECAELNQTWRNTSGPTNVLSFPADASPEIQPRLLGDVIICAPVVLAEAGEQGKKVEDHWAHMVIHGTLHLLGYDHINEKDAEKMEELESRLLATLKIENPYN